MLEHAKVIWLIRTLSPPKEIRGTALTRYVGTCKGHLTDQNIFPKKSETLHSLAMLEHAKVIWLIRTSSPKNQKHCTHSLCWNMQRSFDWSEHPSWEIRGTALTCYIETCKGHLTDQNIFPEKSEPLYSQPILEHAKVIWLIKTFFPRNQRHCTHILCWNMQRSFDWSEHFSQKIRDTALTTYVGLCIGHLTDQNIFSKNSEALHSHPILEHAKVIWLIRRSFPKYQRHCTHSLCWNIQRSFDWSEHSSWEITGTALTTYVGTCKGHLTDQNILLKKSEALHSHTMLEHAKIIWLIRTFFPRNQRHCTHSLCWNMQRSFDWSEHPSWEIRGTALTHYIGTCMQRSFDWSEHPFWEIRGTALTPYVGTCKSHLTNQNILPEKSEALHSPTMLEHAKVIWLIRTFFLRNQRHCTHSLCWNMHKSFDWSEHPFWEIRGTALTHYVGTCKGYLTDQNIFSEKSKALHSPTMLEHAKVIWLIRTSFLRIQRHCTHNLCWNMQRTFDWSKHSSQEIRGTALTSYVGTCKDHLPDQNILPKKSEALHSLAMLEHAKIIWLIRTSFLKNQRHCTHSLLEHAKVIWLIRTSFPRNQRHCAHPLCWNMQRSFHWSEHSSQEIRGIALTRYVGTCMTNQNIFPKKSEALHSHSML